ncbi:MAG: hypothetical protein JSV10_06710 [Candidatus Zixiibacteriota bacterium]|nr:MAG: hypothetical protein JSV10_06710 [candidate division Zixibacteria bacterium]
MRQWLVIISVLLVFSFVLQCDKEKPPEIDFEDPGRYYLINQEYTWTYARLGLQCIVSEDDTFVVTAQKRATRVVEGVSQNGWDIVAVTGGGGTGFVYRVADTIFYWADVSLPQVLPYKVLVGPIADRGHWTDRPRHEYEYDIEGFEDYYSAAANHTYKACAKVKRIDPGQSKVQYTWWAAPEAKVAEVYYESAQCTGGWQLKRRDTNPEYP